MRKRAHPSSRTPGTPFPYGALRLLHLAATSALVPLGLWHWLQTHPDASGFTLIALFLVIVFLALFVIVLDQADYPTNLAGALGRTGPLLLNAAAALWASGNNLLASAYWTFTSLMAAFTGLFVVVAVLGWRMKDERGLVLGFIAPCALGSAVLLGLITRPLFGALTPDLPGIASAAAWLLHAITTTVAWFKMSVFAKYLETDKSKERQQSFERAWTGPAALALVAVMCACLVELASAAR